MTEDNLPKYTKLCVYNNIYLNEPDLLARKSVALVSQIEYQSLAYVVVQFKAGELVIDEISTLVP